MAEVEDVSSEALPLSHVITAELFLPRDFSTGLLVHVAQEPALVNVLKVRFSFPFLVFLLFEQTWSSNLEQHKANPLSSCRPSTWNQFLLLVSWDEAGGL